MYSAARFYISLQVVFQRVVEEDHESTITFRTSASDLLNSTPIEDEVARHIDVLAVEIDKFVRNGKI